LAKSGEDSYGKKIIETRSSKKKDKIPNLNYDPKADESRIKKI
jgi:hypothetical protein